MRSFKIIKSIIFILILVLCSRLLTYLLYPISSLNRHFINYHTQKDNIDFLVLGSSLEGDGINADVISKEFDQTAFVFSPQGSYPESLYYLLLDVTNNHKIKNLLVGWDILQNYENPPYVYPHKEELYREFLHDMKGNLELQKIVFREIMDQRYTSTFFDWSSFPENITSIPDVLKSRKPDYVVKDTSERIDPTNINKKKYRYNQVVETNYSTVMTENDAFYLLKIKEFCHKKSINFFVISSPIPTLVLDEKPELQASIEDSYNFMEVHEIPYIHCNNQIFFPNSMDTENFKDFFGHIISPYRETYTKAICDWIKSTGKVSY